jgi:hypothetical protein
MARIGRRVVIIGVAALFVAGGGTAAAAVISRSPVDNSGVIHGCWSKTAINGSHVFVLQDAGTSCPNGTTAISWNQIGPQGPQGPAGPQGPSTAGPGGLDTQYVFSGWATSPNAKGQDIADAVAYCPFDHPFLISGGYTESIMSSSFPDVPFNMPGWTVEAPDGSFPINNGNLIGPEGPPSGFPNGAGTIALNMNGQVNFTNQVPSTTDPTLTPASNGANLPPGSKLIGLWQAHANNINPGDAIGAWAICAK